MSDTLLTKCVAAAQLLKAQDADYFAPVIRMLLAKEKGARHTKRGKRVVAVSKWTKGNQTNEVDLKWFEEQGRITELKEQRP